MIPSHLAVVPQLQADHQAVSALFLKGLKSELTRKPMPLGKFLQRAWSVLEPNRSLVGNWHIDYLVEHLEAVTLGQIRRLIINVPPRSLKSNLVSVAWPAWSWTFKPWTRWIFASYAASLSVKHSTDRRTVIESPWYQSQWGLTAKMADDQNQKMVYENTARGSMTATSVGGSITGKGCDIEVMDDLINPEDAESVTKREAGIEFYRQTLATRLDDKKTGAMVIVEQRLNIHDLTAVALKEGGWTHLKLPMETTAPATFVFPSGRVYERTAGELLHPLRDTQERIDELKIRLGSRTYKAQYQQDPIAKDGGLLKYEWWKFYNRAAFNAIPVDVRPTADASVWAWDTAAETGKENDYTAGVRMEKINKRYRVTHIVRKKLEYPEMKRRVVMEYQAAPADSIRIEKTSNGQAVLQDFRRSTDLPVVDFISTKDKPTRVNIVSPLVEAGLVELPEDDPMTPALMDEAAAFPSGEHDDVVDAIVIALMILSGKSSSAAAGLHVMTEEGYGDE